MTAPSFIPMYPDVLEKITDEDYLLCGKSISKQKFLRGMKKCGFDIDFTINTLRMLNIGGKWFLSLSDKQKKNIFKEPTSGTGFYSWETK